MHVFQKEKFVIYSKEKLALPFYKNFTFTSQVSNNYNYNYLKKTNFNRCCKLDENNRKSTEFYPISFL